MISSVAARRARPEEAAPWRLRSSGAPNRTVTGARGAASRRPAGSPAVPMSPTGTTVAPVCEREPRHARAAAVQAAVERPGALGVEREGRAGLEDAAALVEGLLRLRARRRARRSTAPIAVKKVRDTQPENPVPVK